MTNPVLSICIPTRNRAHIIEQTINMLLSETQALRDVGAVEIICSDNASSDATFDVLQRYVGNKGFSRIRNETDIGISQNLVRCANVALGRFIWFFGDDDVIQHEYIQKIVCIICNHKYSFLLTRYCDFVDQINVDITKKEVNIRDMNITDIDQFIYKYDRYLGFITSCIYEATLLKRILNTSSELWGNNYLVKYISYLYLLNSKCAELDGGLIFKRCSGGSHFVQNNFIIVKTFIYDQAEVAQRISCGEEEFGSSMLKYYLSNARLFYNLRHSGFELITATADLKRSGVRLKNLFLIFTFAIIPTSVFRLIGLLHLIFWRRGNHGQ